MVNVHAESKLTSKRPQHVHHSSNRWQAIATTRRTLTDSSRKGETYAFAHSAATNNLHAQQDTTREWATLHASEGATPSASTLADCKCTPSRASPPYAASHTVKLTHSGRNTLNIECYQLNQLYPLRHQWFHVLLNSLFKVLFNFPSRYLFAIGLVAVFSLRCGIPPTLSCTPKQLDSKTRLARIAAVRTGLSPSLVSCFPANFRLQQRTPDTPIRNTSPRQSLGDYALGLSVFTRRY